MIPVLPYGRTARRLEWLHLPPAARRCVEERLGSPVVAAESRGAGFSPGLASVLTTEDGRRVFLKAASRAGHRAVAATYAEEARFLGLVDDAGAPVPRLLWSDEVEGWVLLAVEHVDAVLPERPWTDADLERALDAVEACTTALAPLLATRADALALPSFAEAYAEPAAAWEEIAVVHADLPHRAEATRLAASAPRLASGDAVVHSDVRDDAVLLGADGSTWVCDWAWPVRGAAWVDTVLLLVGAYGDGLDADAALASRRLTRDVPADHVDALLALQAGYLMRQCERRPPPSSPWLREHQRWYAQVSWEWLAARRGWRI